MQNTVSADRLRKTSLPSSLGPPASTRSLRPARPDSLQVAAQRIHSRSASSLMGQLYAVPRREGGFDDVQYETTLGIGDRAMDEVLAKAADLGRAIRGTEKYRALRAAEGEVMKDEASVTLAQALATLQEEGAAAIRAGKPLDPAVQERLEKIAGAAAIDPKLQALAKSQKEFQALVDEVSRTMLAELKP